MLIKRILVFVLCLMSTTVFANTKQELRSAFNELNYDLTVEWDQKDKAVLTAKLERFQSVIGSLREKGVSNKEIQDALKGMINNPQLVQTLELQASLNLLNNDKALTDFIWKNRKSMTAQGASWNGTVDMIVTLSIAAVVIAALLIVINNFEYVCTKKSSYYCEERWNCEVPGTEETGCLEGYWYDWCGEDCIEGHNSWR